LEKRKNPRNDDQYDENYKDVFDKGSHSGVILTNRYYYDNRRELN
jgi:hypothetical protein